MGSHQASPGLPISPAQRAHSVHEIQARLSTRHHTAGMLTTTTTELAKVPQPPRLWQLTTSASWGTWCASQWWT